MNLNYTTSTYMDETNFKRNLLTKKSRHNLTCASVRPSKSWQFGSSLKLPPGGLTTVALLLPAARDVEARASGA